MATRYDKAAVCHTASVRTAAMNQSVRTADFEIRPGFGCVRVL